MDVFPNPEDLRNELDEELCMNVSSGTDCTGAVPAAPADENELESYAETYDFLPNAVKTEPRDRC